MKEIEEMRLRLREAQRDIVWAYPQLSSLQQNKSDQIDHQGRVVGPSSEKSSAEWVVTFNEHRTRKTPKSKFRLFSNKEAAVRFVADLAMGKPVYFREHGQPIAKDEISYIQGLIDRKAVGGDEQYGIDIRVFDLRDVLEIDEIIDVHGKTSPIVLETLGAERLSELHERFSDLWPIAAQMEFVMRERSIESAPYVAAAIRYQLHVEKNSRAAGYLLNELVYLVRGEERILLHALQTGMKAGDGGTKNQVHDMVERVVSFMGELYRLRFQTKKFSKLHKVRLVQIAFENLKKKNSVLWREGQGQLEDYLGYLKDGEFGGDNQRSYFEVFPEEYVEKADIFLKRLKPFR